MGKIRNFDKIEFTPVLYRIGDLELRNYYEDGEGVKHTLNAHIYKGFSCFQIAKYTAPKSCYVIAYWTDLDNDECSPDLKFVGSRPFELNEHDTLLFMEMAKIGQYRIQSELQAFEKSNTY